MHLLTKPFLLPLLLPLMEDAVEGSSYSKLFEDEDVQESCGISDFALESSDCVGEGSRTNDVTDSVPSANLFSRRLRLVNRASGSRLRARSNISRIFGTNPRFL
jgi:hypothetical protein